MASATGNSTMKPLVVRLYTRAAARFGGSGTSGGGGAGGVDDVEKGTHSE